jgi:hypothetical protein
MSRIRMFHTLAALSYTPRQTHFRNCPLQNSRSNELTHFFDAAPRPGAQRRAAPYAPGGRRTGRVASSLPAAAALRVRVAASDVAHKTRGRARHSFGHASSFLRVLPSRTTLQPPPARHSPNSLAAFSLTSSPQRFARTACGSLRLENQSGGTQLTSGGRSCSGPAARSVPHPCLALLHPVTSEGCRRQGKG